MPDPNPSKKKNLTVEYTLNGSKNQKSFDDGENWKMSAPPNVKNKNTKATDFIQSIMMSIFSAPFKFLGWYLLFWSMYTIVEYGVSFNAFFNINIPVGLWYCLGLIPFSSVYLIPIINFVIILYYGGSIYATT